MQESKVSAIDCNDKTPQNENIDHVVQRLRMHLSTGEPLGFEGLDEKTKERLDNLDIWDYI